MKSAAVLGCGYGDEGKGRVVSYLCQKDANPIIVRFTGGHQAGHQVIRPDNIQHVSSNFGSGVLYNVPTFWCANTVDPVGIYKEVQILALKGIKNPKLFIHESCAVVTPYDKIANIQCAKDSLHGTCGVGYGKTIQREVDHYHINFKTLFHKQALKLKLATLPNYYGFNTDLTDFMQAVDWVCSNCSIADDSILERYPNVIFEGSQGLLLDERIGFFPHVTRGRTDLSVIPFWPNAVYLVTRAYHTRHGNGPMHENESIPCNISHNPYEHNRSDGMQGKFRHSWLDIDLLFYAISHINHKNKILVVTCMDQMEEFRVIEGGRLSLVLDKTSFISKLSECGNFNKILLSYSPTSGLLEV